MRARKLTAGNRRNFGHIVPEMKVCFDQENTGISEVKAIYYYYIVPFG